VASAAVNNYGFCKSQSQVKNMLRYVERMQPGKVPISPISFIKGLPGQANTSKKQASSGPKKLGSQACKAMYFNGRKTTDLGGSKVCACQGFIRQ